MQSTRFGFTGAKLRSLAAPAIGRTYFYDADVRGLAIELTANGAKSFRVYRKFQGRPIKITLGPFDPDLPETRELPDGAQPIDLLGNHPALNVRMARKLAIAVMRELDTGVNPAERNRGLTLGKVFTTYREHLRAEGKKGVDGVVWYWQRYLGQLPEERKRKHGQERQKAPGGVDWENREMAQITHPHVVRLRVDLAEKVGRTTANRVMQLLKAIFNYARRERLFNGENPVKGIRLYNLPSRDRFLREEEVRKFFETLQQFEADFQDYVNLSIYVGARRGNVLRMRWDEVSLDGGRWTVTGEKMKNGENLTIPLVVEAVEILRRRAQTAIGDWVFAGETKKGHAGPFRRQWERFVKAAGVPDLHVHDLRRSLGTWMISSGSSTALTMRALGHKTIHAALVYQRALDRAIKQGMQRAVSAITKAGAGKRAPAKVVPLRLRTRASSSSPK
jgi:integrase